MIFKKAIYPVTLSLLVTACNGGGDGGSDTSNNSSSNTTTNNGITVTVTAAPRQSPDAQGVIRQAPAGVKTFNNSEDVQITLSKAYLTIWSVQIETHCDTRDFSRLWQPLFNFLMAPVQAHAQETPTQLGTPNVINLLAEDSVEMKLGTIQPPPNTYCGASIEFAKADEDAHYLPTDVNMINRTLHLEGHYVMPESKNTGFFAVDTSKTLLPRRAVLPGSLNLSASHLTGKVGIGIRYDRWFDGLNPAILTTDETQQNLLFDNLNSSITLQ